MIRSPLSKNQSEWAESVALQALAFILGDDDRRAGFLSLTGMDATGLRQGADDPAFLGGVLDFILQDESLTIGFAAETGLPPEAPARARGLLPGAVVETNW